MKKLMRKAITVLGSVAMVGATISTAAAAAYPAPFNDGAYAVVYGADADVTAATTVANGLPAIATTAATTVGGDSFKFEKSSTKYHLGDAMTDVISSDLDEDQMPVLLNDGTFTDDDNDEFDFTQKIALDTGLTLTMFDDNDYATDDPSVGFKITSGADILTYTLEFSEEPLIADLPTTDLTLMGKPYYVLAATVTKLTLLDSAADTIVAEGETVTLEAGDKTYSISIEFIDADSAKLNVNGEITNDIATTETYKLDDGSYLGMKEILYSAKDTGISKAEFSIGNGKLVLENGQDVNLNEDSIDGLTSTIVNNSASLTSVAIDWDSEDELFIAEDSVVTMPGFEAVSLVYTGLNFPEEETIEIGYDGDESAVLKNFPLQDSVEDINILYTGALDNFTGFGKDSDELLLTGASSITFDADTDSYFVASWTDGRDAESYLMRASSFKVDNTVNKTTFQYKKDGSWADAKADRKDTDTFSVGNVEIAVGAINKVAKTVVITNNSVATNFNTLYSAEGLKVILPSNVSGEQGYHNTTITNRTGSFILQTIEEDKDGDVGLGDQINVTIALNSQTPKEVTVTTVTTSNADATSSEIGDTDVFRDFTYSALATEILFDKGGDQDLVTLIYHGDEVAADVYVSSSDVTTSGTSGTKKFMDTESASYADKNIVVVGGSCVNSVAATLLGSTCGDSFTGVTGVGPGEFLIESFDYNGKIATVVAGYEQEDTAKAATYLANEDNAVSTEVGAKYVGKTVDDSAVLVS
jgi:hypothetical protein